MDTKGEPGSEGLTPRPDIDEFKGRVAAGEYDRLQNGAEVYESPNGIRFVIDGQGGADLIVGKDQPPKTEALEEGHTIITPARDLHQEALDRNARANEGFKPLTPMPENGKDFFAREDEIQRQARRDARHQEALDANARANEGFKPLTPMPENGKDFFARQGEIAKHAREEQEEVDITPEKTIEELQIEIQELKEENQRLLAERNALIEKGYEDAHQIGSSMVEVYELSQEVARLAALLEANGITPEVTPVTPEVTPVTPDVTPVTPDVTPVTPDVTPVTPEVTPVTPGVTRIEPPIQPQVPPVTPEVTPVTPEVTPVTPDVTPVTPDVTPVTPDVTPVTPDVTPVTPEVTPVTPDVTPVTPEVTPVTPEVTPVAPGVTRIEPPIQPQVPPVTPEMQAAANADILELRRQLADLRGENTPEQRSAALGAQLAQLEQIQQERELTDAEKILFFNLTREKSQIDRGIASVEGEMQARRENKEKWIKRAGFVAGIGVALATPAVGVAAILAVTLGGNVIGRGLKKLEGRVRAKSSAMKYESRTGKSLAELVEMDKKQKRSEWWANRLGEASALLIGGASGYGFGSIIQNVFGVGFGAGAPTPPAPEVPPTGEITPPTGEIIPPDGTGGAELPPTGEIIPPVEGAGGAESWMTGDSFNASDFGWQYDKFGWLGDRVFLNGEMGGIHGAMQGEYFTELSKLVPKETLMGQQSGEIVNQFLGNAYRGANPVEAAQQAAKVLLGGN